MKEVLERNARKVHLEGVFGMGLRKGTCDKLVEWPCANVERLRKGAQFKGSKYLTCARSLIG